MKKSIELNMGELFKKFLESKEEENTVEIPVGKVSEETRLKFKAWKMDKHLLDDELEVEQEKLAREMKRRILELFSERLDEIQDRKKLLWEEIYKEIGVMKDDNENYVIDARTGEITKEVKKIDLFGNKSHGLQ